MNEHDLLRTIGSNIRQLREGKNWSQADLGEKLGCSMGRISQIEIADRMDVGITTLVKIANVFGIAPQRLLTRLNPIGVLGPLNYRPRGGGKKPRAVAQLLAVEPPKEPSDHHGCDPQWPERLCGECAEMFGAAKEASN